MYEDKTLICKDCGKEFIFTAGEQHFTLKKVLKMNLQDVKNAVSQEKTVQELQKSFMTRFVQTAERIARFHLSRKMTVLFIAAPALQK